MSTTINADAASEFDLGRPAPDAAVKEFIGTAQTQPRPAVVTDDDDSPLPVEPDNLTDDLATEFLRVQRLSNNLTDTGERILKPGTRREQRIRAARLQRCKLHVHALQQGPVAPPITADELAQARLEREGYRGSQSKRLAELARKNPLVRAAVEAASNP